MRKLLLHLSIAAVTFAWGAAAIRLRHNHHRTPVLSTAATDEIMQPKFRCDTKPVLPTNVKRLLDSNFPGWQFHSAPQEDCDTVKSIGGQYAYPEMIIGDFDGNGRSDYAVLIDGDPARPANFGIYIVAFLASDSSYRIKVVTHEGGDSLLLMRRGSPDFDYETQHEFIYSNDAIFSGVGMGGYSYLYENGKFRAIITSD